MAFQKENICQIRRGGIQIHSCSSSFDLWDSSFSLVSVLSFQFVYIVLFLVLCFSLWTKFYLSRVTIYKPNHDTMFSFLIFNLCLFSQDECFILCLMPLNACVLFSWLRNHNGTKKGSDVLRPFKRKIIGCMKDRNITAWLV